MYRFYQLLCRFFAPASRYCDELQYPWKVSGINETILIAYTHGGNIETDVYEAIELRKSVRKYLNREVESDKLIRVLNAARLAPSASNRQEWRFVVVTDSWRRKELADASGRSFLAQAPVIIICCAATDHHIMTCSQLCYPIDTAIAIDHITLAAVAEGLGTCWIGAFNAEKTKKIAGIPPKIKIVELLALGYPVDPLKKEKARLPLDEIVYYEKWKI